MSLDLALPPPHSTPPATETGFPLPLGPHIWDGGINFSLFSRHATQVWLELYDEPADAIPRHRFSLTAPRHRTGDLWHIWVEGLVPGQLYGYRVDGPYAPEEGHRFNPYKLLLDPYAAAITHMENWDFRRAQGYDASDPRKDLSFSTENNADTAPKCVVTERRTGWEERRPLRRPWADTIIYELHVRGFTVDPSSDVEHPGTYRGLIEKIPYLQDLGITAVELMPVQEFNEREIARVNPLSGEPLRNYWGYNPATFFAPNGLYSSTGTQGEQVEEFKDMVKAFHEAGIEVILDVVFNHTAEGDEIGPTMSWRGLDNRIYYLLTEDRRFYKDYTGTGNTVKSDHPVVRDLILDALRYWVVEMHVDGFRFDLASVLGRDEDGQLLADPPLLERIAHDPVLRNVKMIAEAWDAAGAYQVGQFPAKGWSEWNGHFRDDVRRFWRGDSGMLGTFASRLAGSSDLYGGGERGPESSINYVTSHDGFTLNDLVSYAEKHNEANGEFNRDGTDANYSANYGVEGPTEDPQVNAVRTRQIKNVLLTLLLSHGVPMLLGGDEFRRTQYGNNNAYCQDNEVGWWLWDRLDDHSNIHRFVRELITARRAYSPLQHAGFYTDEDLQWIGPQGESPRWEDSEARALGCYLPEKNGLAVLLLFNAGREAVDFDLPMQPNDRRWHRKADTALPSPDDITPLGETKPLDQQTHYTVDPQSSVVLVAPA
ncbi:glycogen debranching enzyme GlgX [Salinibacter sp. 10B]|uniref:glycogen debranching protein GlgX n=1 Tax=Salinibacter sp. 10B TaxID=1923971 RepID=UPI000CF4EC8A|nr:glycogen debranching protein GlgX [Salinibacter sp. 10B]PQJ35680.1 glycogen debranching enzyme GlgX [Salinibacter sp. 10B]